MITSYIDLIRELKENKYAPFYFLEGEEPFFIDQIVDFIEENAIDESQKAFNQVVMYGKDCTVSDIMNQARRFPVMSDRQVVIVKEAQEITDFEKEVGIKQFESYLKNPVPSTILVLAYKYNKLDKRTAMAKLVASAGVHFQAKKIYENELEKWVKIILDQKQLKADPKAVFLIAENIGLDLSRINNELEKVRLSIGQNEIIDEARVHKFIGVSREYNAWELQKAFATVNKKKVFSIIKYLEQNPKAAPLMVVLANLYTLFSRILVIQQMNYNNPKLLQEKMGINYFGAQEYLSGARIYPKNKIPAIISSLRSADAKLKGVDAGQMKESEILKELALQILP